MAFNIDQFIARIAKGGARPTLFEVRIDSPPSQSPRFDADTKFFIQAAQLPASTIGVIPITYFGRQMKVAGDRMFEPWNVEVINEEDFKIRNKLEAWSTRINGLQTNTRLYAQEREYKTTAVITQYSKTGEAIRRYKFIGIFPAQVGAIQTSWAAQNQIEVFSCMLEYDYYVLEDTGNVDPLLLADLSPTISNLLAS